MGIGKLINFEPGEFYSSTKHYINGPVAGLFSKGTLWAVLGLINFACREGQTPDMFGSIRLLSDRLWVSAHAIEELEYSVCEILAVLEKHDAGMPHDSQANLDDNLQAEEQYDIASQLINAFTHQVAIVQRVEGSHYMQDVLSRQSLHVAPMVGQMIDWDDIFARSGNDVVVGIYTGIKIRKDVTPMEMSVTDWTWIPWRQVIHWAALFEHPDDFNDEIEVGDKGKSWN